MVYDVCRRPYVIECGNLEGMYFIYALYSRSSGKIYVGMTKDPERRLKDHNEGRSAYTRNYGPWERFYLEEVTDSAEGRKKEKYLKSGWGRKMLQSKLEEWQSGRMRQS